MTVNKSIADMVFDEEKTIIDFIIEKAEAHKAVSGDSFRPTDAEYWKMVRTAQKEGKKLILINGPAPLEIIYSMDCVPLYMDFVPSRISEDIELTARLIREADKLAYSELCATNKTELGVISSGKLGLIPDAYVSVPFPCDSARTAYSAMSLLMARPVFKFDIPMRRDEKSLRYISMQLESFIEFLEKLTGRALDSEKLKYRVELSNQTIELLEKCVEARKMTPCPMSSHMAVLNELMNAMAPTEEMERLLLKELEICKERTEKGLGPCPDGEKHRVLLMHNLLWQGIDIIDKLESAYGAVTVMDGFPLKSRDYFEHPDDIADCKRTICGKMLWGSTVHGAAVSGIELCETLVGMVRDFGADVSIFLGSAGCRHAWAAQKMISDAILDKFKLPTLVIDADNTDFRYKSEKDIFAAISEYMDTVINKK